MARVRAVYYREKDRFGKQKDTEAHVAVFERDGEKMLQIESRGSQDRQNKGAMSQSLLFNLETLREFMKIVKREFPEACE